MLDNLNLIQMKGRVYDPVIGRLMSPDPVITQVGDSQRGNPYSYVSNRPLTFSDPTGMTEDKPIPQDCSLLPGGSCAGATLYASNLTSGSSIGFANSWAAQAAQLGQLQAQTGLLQSSSNSLQSSSNPLQSSSNPQQSPGDAGNQPQGNSMMQPIDVTNSRLDSVGTGLDIANMFNSLVRLSSNAWNEARGAVLANVLKWGGRAVTAVKALKGGSWKNAAKTVGATIINDGAGTAAGLVVESVPGGQPYGVPFGDAVASYLSANDFGDEVLDPTPGPWIASSPMVNEGTVLGECDYPFCENRAPPRW